MAELQQKVQRLASESMGNEDVLLDVPFSAEEVSAAVSKLKCGKAAGPDGLMAEHLKAGGDGWEFLCLQRLEVVFLEADLPYMNQTAYRRSVSCADAIFTTRKL